MKNLPLFPKPSQQKKPPVSVRTLKSGAEQCNLLTTEGRHEYQSRKREMWQRQAKTCCYFGHLKECPGRLNWADTAFCHETPRGHGGGSREDRILLPDGRWVNGAGHYHCNALAGSRRIAFNCNAAHNQHLHPGTHSAVTTFRAG